jgi:hypothetical protein
MIRSVFLAVLFLVATLLPAPSGRAASYPLNDGQSIVGDPVSINKDGIVFRIGEGQFSKRAGWTNFTQEALKELSKDAKAKVFAEELIEKDEPDPEQVARKKALEIKIKEPDRLDRPDPKAGFGTMFASPLALTLFLLTYAANIYAGFEIGLFRNYHPALVAGVAAVAPVIGPVLFLCLPTRMQTTAEEEAPAEDAAVEYGEAVAADGAAQQLADMPPPPPEAASKYPPTKTFRRGEFTFNRRFFETQMASFLRVVPTEADKEMIIFIKAVRGEFTGSRIARIQPNEVYLLADKGGATQEILIPFAEIQLVQVRHKDAPPTP